MGVNSSNTSPAQLREPVPSAAQCVAKSSSVCNLPGLIIDEDCEDCSFTGIAISPRGVFEDPDVSEELFARVFRSVRSRLSPSILKALGLETVAACNERVSKMKEVLSLLEETGYYQLHFPFVLLVTIMCQQGVDSEHMETTYKYGSRALEVNPDLAMDESVIDEEGYEALEKSLGGKKYLVFAEDVTSTAGGAGRIIFAVSSLGALAQVGVSLCAAVEDIWEVGTCVSTDAWKCTETNISEDQVEEMTQSVVNILTYLLSHNT